MVAELEEQFEQGGEARGIVAEALLGQLLAVIGDQGEAVVSFAPVNANATPGLVALRDGCSNVDGVEAGSTLDSCRATARSSYPFRSRHAIHRLTDMTSVAGDRRNVPRTTDAVIVIPGIMGSELVDADGSVVWGLSAGLLARSWMTGSVDKLCVTTEDIAGGGRLRPTRLLRRVGFMPMLGGIEPYGGLLGRLIETVTEPAALVEFAYDWRLSIDFNAKLLLDRCQQVLDHWREVVTKKRYADPADVKVVLVAHSMGGLVARYATEVLRGAEMVRCTVSLGTPYFGAVKSVQMLASGDGAPLPHRAARRLAVSCPGVYDLLPRYRCVVASPSTASSHGSQLAFLSPSHIGSIGANEDLFAEARERATQVDQASRLSNPLATHAVVGAEQPTAQSLTIVSGNCEVFHSINGIDHGGDSTVYRNAAAPVGAIAFPLPQRHGALARSKEAIGFVVDKLSGADTGPPLGTRPVGAAIPEFARTGEAIAVWVSGTDDPVGVTLTSTHVESGARRGWLPAVRRDHRLLFLDSSLSPGLHRLEVKAGGFSAISDLLLVGAAEGRLASRTLEWGGV